MILGDRYHPDLEYSISKSSKYKDQNEGYWKNLATAEVMKTLQNINSMNTNVAKNVILFIGDGMSLPTVVASRIYKAQQESQGSVTDAEGNLLTFESFPHVGLSKTYAMDRQTPDSSSTASAIYSGVKTNYKTLGFDNSIIYKNSSSQDTSNKVETIMKWAQDQSKSTGFVTSARVTHATPAALYAHVANRDWECDRVMNKDGADNTKDGDITLQLVTQNPGRNVKVVLGGGLNSFCPESPEDAKTDGCKKMKPKPDSAHLQFNYTDNAYWDCTREDKRDLIDEFLTNKSNTAYVSNRKELLSIVPENVDTLLGLFNSSFLSYEDARREVDDDHDEKEPSLAEMTQVAISILRKNANGFFLMVEGSNIDHSHHNSRATQALLETVALDNAVKVAMDSVGTKDTLIIVTADHGHTMSISGYQDRGSDIRGIVTLENEKGTDGKPLMILNYANGEGFDEHLYAEGNATDHWVVRKDLNAANYTEFKFKNPSPVPLDAETHGGSDVGIYAIGPYSHLFQSVHEQNYIAYVMSYSACIGPFQPGMHDNHCEPGPSSATESPPYTSKFIFSINLLTIVAPILLKI
jgi:alkaline phosphatase